MGVIDAYEGKPMFTLAGYQNNKGLPIEASFTPDSQFVVSGSTDGLLHLWRTEDGRSAGVLTGEHQGPVTNVQFNPRFCMMASVRSSLNMWLPGDVNVSTQNINSLQGSLQRNAPPGRGQQISRRRRLHSRGTLLVNSCLTIMIVCFFNWIF